MMGISCSCDYDGDWDWWYSTGESVKPLDTKRGRICCSCKERIDVGDLALKIRVWRNPENDIEERIYGDEVPLADKYMCQDCGLTALFVERKNACFDITENIQDQFVVFFRDYLWLTKEEFTKVKP